MQVSEAYIPTAQADATEPLPAALRDEIAQLAQRHGVRKVVLYGSRARGAHRRTSDIDLAIQGGNTTLFALDAEDELRTLLRFDVVDLDGPVQPALLASINQEGQVLYEQAQQLRTCLQPGCGVVDRAARKRQLLSAVQGAAGRIRCPQRRRRQLTP
ncbi:MAG: nucleotidyltransferase domain-containing protein [Eggerthellaceae bacterium]|nr:nucleotidyltransferase domain-containing protein [Eggerthellaceae bacterium]